MSDVIKANWNKGVKWSVGQTRAYNGYTVTKTYSAGNLKTHKRWRNGRRVVSVYTIRIVGES